MKKLNRKVKRLEDSVSDSRTYCECGHSIIMLPSTDSKICTNCGRRVKNTSKTSFMYKLTKEMNKDKWNLYC